MRSPFLLCFTLLILSACGTSREERFGRAEPPPDAAAAEAPREPDHTVMWAEPAGLFLVGLESGQATLAHAPFLSALDGQWTAADTDGDGTLRALEFQAWRVRWFGSDDGWPGLFHFDANADGVISKAEFKSGLDAVFANFDKNKDGVIDRAELLVEKRAREMRFGPPGGPKMRGGRGRPDGSGGGEGSSSPGRPEELPKPAAPPSP
ncbi:MAG: EF-hand domain-containing protein [Alphaproteobacteria bacterium]